MTTPKKSTGIRIPTDLDRRLTKFAKDRGLTKNTVMNLAIRDFVYSSDPDRLSKTCRYQNMTEGDQHESNS